MDTYNALSQDRDRRLPGFGEDEHNSGGLVGGGAQGGMTDVNGAGSEREDRDGGDGGSRGGGGGKGGLWAQLSWPERRMIVELTAGVPYGYVHTA